MEHTVAYDAGAVIRDGIKSVAQRGVCPENDWPYEIKRFAVKPSINCYEEAKLHKALRYSAIEAEHLDTMKQALALGEVFVFGFTVYESFESAEVAATGMMSLPEPGESVLGGHAVMAVGYDDSKSALVVRNSWGAAWGLEGYFYMPYAYIQKKLAADFWVINQVS